MNHASEIIILGGRSLITPYLIEKLGAVTITSRSELPVPDGIKSLQLDLKKADGWSAPENSIVISLLPIWVLTQHLDLFAKAKTLVVMSSTSRYGKASSTDKRELEIVKWIEDGERKIQEWTTPNGPTTTILRPTLIYDCKNDANITRIMKAIEKYGIFPIAPPALGKRQPIHAADVAGAIIASIDNKDAMNRAFNIAGGEVLTYVDMVARIFKKMGKPPRLLAMPWWFIRTGLFFMRLTRFIHKMDISEGVFQRMNEDLVFDNKQGLEVLQYNPRKFL